MHLGLAERAREEGRERTAGEAFVRAALCFHFAKYVWVLDAERNRETTIRARDALYEAHRLLDPTAERIEAAIAGGGGIVANLRRPPEASRPALVLLIPGLDSTKEEFFQLRARLPRPRPGDALAGRARAGGGRVASRRSATTTRSPSAAALDALGRSRRPRPRPGRRRRGQPRRLLRAARRRLRAAPAGGAGVSGPRNFGALWDDLPELTRESFAFYSRSPDDATARERAEALDLAGVAERISQPLLVIAGKPRPADPVGVDRGVAEEAPDATFVLYEEGNHVCNNVAYRYRPLLADWLGEQLA